MNETCSTETHQAIKLDSVRWLALAFVGFQVIEAYEDDPEERLELRNCTCGSTLCKLVSE